MRGRARRVGRWVVSAVLGAGFVMSSTSAVRAQGVYVNLNTISRLSPWRPNEQHPFAISYSDCVADDAFEFEVVLTSFQGLALEAWAGVECESADNRLGIVPSCSLLYRAEAVRQETSVFVRVQDIVAPSRGSYGVDAGRREDCETGTGDRVPKEVDLYFMLVDGSRQLAGTFSVWSTTYDLAGPPAPTEFQVAAADGHLVAGWREPSAVDVMGYRIYCDPPPGSERGADAGLASDDCGSEVLIEGEAAWGLSLHMCGVMPSPIQLSGEARGLTNGVRHAAAVAAYDTVGNVGQLSRVACATPTQVERTKSGYCAVHARPAKEALGVMLLALILACVRRRQRA